MLHFHSMSHHFSANSHKLLSLFCTWLAHVRFFSSRLVRPWLGSLVLMGATQCQLWLGPIPITLQTCAVAGLGACLGPWGACGAVGLYGLQGALGAPVFVGGRFGAQALLGHTGGYLWAMVPAAWLGGQLWQQVKIYSNPWWVWLVAWMATFLSSFLILCGGVVGLMCYLPPAQAYLVGMAPFLAVEGFKSLSFASLYTLYWFQKGK